MSDAYLKNPQDHDTGPGCGPFVLIVLFVGFLLFDEMLAVEGGTFADVFGYSDWSQFWHTTRRALLCTLPLVFLVVRWLGDWLPLPRPNGVIKEGCRTTIEGTIVSAEELLPVPLSEDPDQRCVAWMCYGALDLFDGQSGSVTTVWVPRTRPFQLKLTSGQIVHITIDTPNWHSRGHGLKNSHGYLTIAERAEVAAALETALREYPIPPRDEISNPTVNKCSFATINVGDQVTISGYFSEGEPRVTPKHYREIAAEPSYRVRRASELDPGVLPPRDSAADRFRRATTPFNLDAVLLLPMTFRESRKFFSHAGLAFWATLWLIFVLWSCVVFVAILIKVGIFGL